MKFLLYTLPALASLVLFSVPAFADCEHDVGTDVWNELSTRMNDAYTSDRYEDALQSALALEQMCSTPPTLLYIISDSYQHLGNEEKSAEYIKRASLNLSKYDLPQSFIEQVWFRRAELELPIHGQVVETRNENEKLKAELGQAQTMIVETTNKANSEKIDTLNTVMWTGAGAAIGGGVLAIAGAVMTGYGFFNIDGSAVNVTEPEDNGTIELKDNYLQIEKAGIALLGVGGTLAVAGTVVAVLAHLELTDIELSNDDVSLKFDAGLASVGVTMTF